MNDYVIYKHTSPDGKSYIGITKQDLNQRWRNGEGYRRCTAFYRAIKKYGWDNITHEILDTAENLESANEKEKYYISLYGYNCTEGGDGVQGWKATDEQKEKNSNAKKMMWEDVEMRERLTAERRERAATEEERKRLHDMVTRNWADPDKSERLKEHLAQIANDEECKKKRAQKMRALWKEAPDRFMSNRVYKSGAAHKCSKPVKCIETGAVYANAREAEKQTGISYKQISQCARGKIKTTHGQHWEFVLVM